MGFPIGLLVLLQTCRVFGRLAAPQPQQPLASSHGMCAPQWFHIRSERFRNYSACVQDGLNNTDLTVTGANLAVKSDCWCRFNMTYFMTEQGCAQHRNWRQLAELECNPQENCSSAEALRCMKECPALCWEVDYTMDGCNCQGCAKQLHCIVEESLKETAAGVRNHTCDERAVLASEAWDRYNSCLNRAPYRTSWDRYQAGQFCACSSGLHEELQNDSCCEVNGNGTAHFALAAQCDASCQVDCDTAEAQQCLQDCASDCVEIDQRRMTEACKANCMASNSTCHKYSVCKPRNATLSFGYFCDDGSEPDSNGCCGSPLNGGGCPTLCEYQTSYYFFSKTQQGALTPQCKCSECPATREETYTLMNKTWLRLFERTGARHLLYTARRFGLPGPTAEMDRLFVLQIEAIAQAMATHGWDAELKEQIYKICRIWMQRIWNAAEDTRESFFFRTRYNLAKLFWLFLIPLWCSIVLLVAMCVRKKRLVERMDVARQADAPQLVMGRPVGPDVSQTPDAIVHGVLLGRVAGGANLPSGLKDDKVAVDEHAEKAKE